MSQRTSNTSTSNSSKATNKDLAVKPNTCNECGGDLIHTDVTDEIYCKDCGVIHRTENIDHGPDWSVHNDNTQSSSRASRINVKKHDLGLSTEISYANKDAKGNRISNRKRVQINRLRKWQKRFTSGKNQKRTLKNCLAEIDRMGTALDIPNHTIELGSMLQRQAIEAGLTKNRSIEELASGILYIACRINQISRTFDEITRVSRVNKDRIREGYKTISRELDIKIPLASPKEYIPRFCSDLNLPKEFEKTTTRLQRNYCRQENISGESPVSIAAASIYAASLYLNNIVPQNKISEKTDVSEYTIQSLYHKILRCQDDIDSETLNCPQGEKRSSAIAKQINNVEKSTYYISEYP